MDADLKSLEDKIGKLISFCATLREENAQLRDDLGKAQRQAVTLKNNMQLAGNKLEALLQSLPPDSEST